MTHIAHELAREFPANAETIHVLRRSDRHFSALCDRYHAVNRDIHRIETGLEATADERLEMLKKVRLSIADEVATILGNHTARR